MAKTRVPAVEGWFRLDGDDATLLGLRDPGTGSYFFPREQAVSRPPQAGKPSFEEVDLSRTGTLWSYTTNHYAPPDPYVSPDPFVPYTVCAVQLNDEQLVVLGQLVDDQDPADLEVGAEMELAAATLHEDDENEYMVWKWRRAGE